jgi:hypothetical protein
VGFFLLDGCSLESYVSRYDGEIGGGKEEKEQTQEAREKNQQKTGRAEKALQVVRSRLAERVGEELPGTSKQQW